eukprot:13706576-Alexandrium_andersonii.AAC.1
MCGAVGIGTTGCISLNSIAQQATDMSDLCERRAMLEKSPLLTVGRPETSVGGFPGEPVAGFPGVLRQPQ